MMPEAQKRGSVLEDLRLAEAAGVVFPEAEVEEEQAEPEEGGGLEQGTRKRRPASRFSFLNRVFYLRPGFCGKRPVFSLW
jgi:hypothetical protein